jgi:hypothetical protein
MPRCPRRSNSYYYGAEGPSYEPWDERGGQDHANPNTHSTCNVR